MPTFILTDVANDLWVESFATGAADLKLAAGADWSVVKRTLRGGRRDGVDVIELDNGALALTIVPTRGMGIWRGHLGEDRLGWDSPVADGPVNPAFVELGRGGGIGWLDGFDELMVRCGLASNGPPSADGGRSFTLHGRIANLPAHYVALEVADEPPHAITVEGRVDEAHLFGPRLRLTTRLTTEPGSHRAVLRDEVQNLGDAPGELELLYHWNLGPPHLEAGGRLVAPARTIVPRDARAVEGIGHFDTYDDPRSGYAEQVYYYDLIGDGPGGRTLVLLRNRAGDKGFVLRFSRAQLPCFTLWKNTGGLRDGYVTGLEPATNYPNPRPFEKERGRVVTLTPGASLVAETELEVLATAAGVSKVEAEIAALQAQAAPTVHERPIEPFTAEG